jgi:FkbM family methyltransferase
VIDEVRMWLSEQERANLERWLDAHDQERLVQLLAEDGRRVQPGPLISLALRPGGVAVQLRPGTTDALVFRQIFLEEQYGALPVRDVKMIIDAGAYTGLSAIYFLLTFPEARVIAIEPDPDGCALAALNLEPFAARCELVQAALWPDETPLVLARGRYRDGREWATQVRPAAARAHREPALAATEPDARSAAPVDNPIPVPPITVAALRERFGVGPIDVFKIDIEGAELELFRPGAIPHVHCYAIELHDIHCKAAFENAIAPGQYRLLDRGEITVAVRA